MDLVIIALKTGELDKARDLLREARTPAITIGYDHLVLDADKLLVEGGGGSGRRGGFHVGHARLGV